MEQDLDDLLELAGKSAPRRNSSERNRTSSVRAAEVDLDELLSEDLESGNAIDAQKNAYLQDDFDDFLDTMCSSAPIVSRSREVTARKNVADAQDDLDDFLDTMSSSVSKLSKNPKNPMDLFVCEMMGSLPNDTLVNKASEIPSAGKTTSAQPKTELYSATEGFPVEVGSVPELQAKPSPASKELYASEDKISTGHFDKMSDDGSDSDMDDLLELTGFELKPIRPFLEQLLDEISGIIDSRRRYAPSVHVRFPSMLGSVFRPALKDKSERERFYKSPRVKSGIRPFDFSTPSPDAMVTMRRLGTQLVDRQ